MRMADTSDSEDPMMFTVMMHRKFDPTSLWLLSNKQGSIIILEEQ